MRPIFLLVTALLVASLAAPVAAQENTTATGPGLEAELTNDECTIHIDRFVSICSAEYRNGEAILELRSDRRESITVTDAGGMMRPGEILRRDFIVRSDRRTTIRMPVTKANGFAGVTIDTGRTLYGVPLDSSSRLVGGPWTYSDAQAAALGGGVGTALVVLGMTLRTLLGQETGIERLA
jgi:hypothetical protein